MGFIFNFLSYTYLLDKTRSKLNFIKKECIFAINFEISVIKLKCGR